MRRNARAWASFAGIAALCGVTCGLTVAGCFSSDATTATEHGDAASDGAAPATGDASGMGPATNDGDDGSSTPHDGAADGATTDGAAADGAANDGSEADGAIRGDGAADGAPGDGDSTMGDGAIGDSAADGAIATGTSCHASTDCAPGAFCWLSECVALKAIATGVGHTCALTTAGGVQCWGANNAGQLGDGTQLDRATPVAVVGLASGVVAVAAGDTNTCALTSAGAVTCWGDNTDGALGNGTTTSSLVPTPVPSLSSGVVAITAGADFACALTAGGGVQCWGANGVGALGNGTATESVVPVGVSGLTSGVATLVGGKDDTCALTASGSMTCWGDNMDAEIGSATTTNVPVAIDGLSTNIAAVGLGDFHTCALTTAGAVECLGDGMSGDLGMPSAYGTGTPVTVTGLLPDVVAVAGGEYFSCVLTAAGAIQCWGDDTYGQLGRNGLTTDQTVGTVSGLPGAASAMATGSGHACALVGGAAWCWGYNANGELGDGTMADRTAPVKVVEP